MKKKVTKIVRLKNFPLLFPAKRDVKSFRVGRNIFFFPSLFFLFFFISHFTIVGRVEIGDARIRGTNS